MVPFSLREDFVARRICLIVTGFTGQPCQFLAIKVPLNLSLTYSSGLYLSIYKPNCICTMFAYFFRPAIGTVVEKANEYWR